MMWLLVFGSTIVADYFWAKWTMMCTEKRPIAASAYAALIVLAGAFSIVEYTVDHWLIIPAAAGAAVGTFYAVRVTR